MCEKYMHYIAELSSDEIFLTQIFKTQIVSNVKISRSMVYYSRWCFVSVRGHPQLPEVLEVGNQVQLINA